MIVTWIVKNATRMYVICTIIFFPRHFGLWYIPYDQVVTKNYIIIQSWKVLCYHNKYISYRFKLVLFLSRFVFTCQRFRRVLYLSRLVFTFWQLFICISVLVFHKYYWKRNVCLWPLIAYSNKSKVQVLINIYLL